MDKFENAIKILKQNNQEKILKELKRNKKDELTDQILNIDFNKMQECIEKIDRKEEYNDEKIENINCIDEENLSLEERKNALNKAKEIISKGKYAVVTMAGGQRNKTWLRYSKRCFFN